MPATTRQPTSWPSSSSPDSSTRRPWTDCSAVPAQPRLPGRPAAQDPGAGLRPAWQRPPAGHRLPPQAVPGALLSRRAPSAGLSPPARRTPGCRRPPRPWTRASVPQAHQQLLGGAGIAAEPSNSASNCGPRSARCRASRSRAVCHRRSTGAAGAGALAAATCGSPSGGGARVAPAGANPRRPVPGSGPPASRRCFRESAPSRFSTSESRHAPTSARRGQIGQARQAENSL